MLGAAAGEPAACSATATMRRAPRRPWCSRTATGSAASPAVRTSSVSPSRSRTRRTSSSVCCRRTSRLSGSLFAGAPIDVYLPLAIDGNEDIGGFMAVIGRLRPGVTADQARAELASRQAALSVGKWTWMTVLAQQVTPLPDLVTREARSPVLLLFAGIGCVLLMACANLANLLLVRASGRRREMQVRTALGASMGQVLGQMTAESAVLVGIGGTAGVVLAVAVTSTCSGARRGCRSRGVGDLQVGWPAIAFAAAALRGDHVRLRQRRAAAPAASRPHGRAATARRDHDGSARRLRAAAGARHAGRARRRPHGRPAGCCCAA